MSELPIEGVPSDGGPLVFVEDLDVPVLRDDDHHHLARVRRLRAGDPLVLGDGAGCWRAARFAGPTPEAVGSVATCPRADPAITVAFALVKGAKPELVVQKLTELGVDRIVPFLAVRSVVRWDAARAAQHRARLAKVARGAAEQSRQAWLPEVADVASFATVAALPGACLAERGGGPPSLRTPVVLVGPEGGWDATEAAVGLPTVSLGSGVLRAETAAIVAGAVLGGLRAGVLGEGHRGR